MNGKMGIYEWSYGNLWIERWVFINGELEFMNGEMGIYKWRDGYL